MAVECATAQGVGRAVAEEAVKTLLAHVGEAVDRDGLRDTPSRVVRSLLEMTGGYGEDPEEILATTFDVEHDEMIVVRGVRFASLCEHHLLPFIGAASVGYIPGGRVVGISKLVRLVQCFARRLQVQERMTEQIASAIMEYTNARGAGVVLRAHHGCMGCRGVNQPDSEMVASVMLGVMRDRPEARSELLCLV